MTGGAESGLIYLAKELAWPNSRNESSSVSAEPG